MLENGMFIADRYEIVGKIGAGGMSDVYKAKDHTLGRFVAIKVLKQEFSEDSTFVTKFRTEAQSAAGLEHPNIVNIYDVGCENGNYYIVMENVEGITLKTYIEKKGQLTFKEALSIAIQVGRGIQAAHAKNIIHRDIKPQNIIISTEGKVKVTDFGIARAASSNTIHSDVMGSVHYASPEQARNGYVSNRSDIYSLGIVMYEMVTGRVPFDGDSTVAVAIQHLQDEMVAPSAYAKELPISLEKIILKCTQKSPDRRYQTIDDLLIDLRKALLSPNEDFVTMVPLANDKTRVISKDEVDEIQQKTSRQPADEEYEEEEDTDEDEEDEEEDGGKGGFLNPKMEKAVTIMGIVAAIVIAIIVIYLIGSFMGVFHFSPFKNKNQEPVSVSEEKKETVEMIDITGMDFDEAKTKLKGMGLELKQIDTEPSDKYEEGQIISQDPVEGTQVEEGTTVEVVVCASDEEEEGQVPDVAGDASEIAMQKISDAGFKASREFKYDSDVEAGKVISQDPKGGTSLKKGETVTIYVSQGSETVKVPSLLGKTENAAKQALKDAGLNVGKVSQDYSDDYPAGQVMEQSTSSGKYLDKGDTVDLVVSKGPEDTTPIYGYKANISAPSNVTVTSADIELLDSSGDTIRSWDGVTKFPYSINVTDIEGESGGTLQIIWYYTTEDGRSQTDVQEKKVTFTRLN
ncbi:Serine/threonine-protein kinase PrkC [uncultured Roseburia sp.]|uniref:non-specific serine/threonine protein kinase n=1 Tax=Brotonthovivens ammoniilytica TaxID=2981725 RepID=A0ABT2TF00_9FIRM|nr:Stk1 family PASTA domain-containing Ser/Thr kinase [Brotonthovivens ammoniilytica]MCU6760768.1 Stk1 family PASTA domain-containing Ser/Thr kinase [Brotonthovivens ammoniilytica]SCI08646.1 Serine/threonine-protein kinase PrkC [uncultured Roseburia sp.]